MEKTGATVNPSIVAFINSNFWGKRLEQKKHRFLRGKLRVSDEDQEYGIDSVA